MRSAQVVVVGGGAAGLHAALHAARRGRRTLLLEKNRAPGLKILISGGGRCNLTTTKEGEDLERQYGTRRGRFLRPALRAFPPRALRAEFEAAGVRLHEEDLDKVFPVSGRARDVLDALLRLCAEAGVEISYQTPMLGIARAESGWCVATSRGEILAESVIVATGGLSYPRTGATGDGYRVLAALGHGLVPPVPALAPLLVEEEWVRGLAGIVLTGVELAVRDRAGRELCRRRRPILFTHRGLSGPAPMDLAGDVEECGGGASVHFDFFPELGVPELDALLVRAAREAGRRKPAAALVSALPPACAERLPERVRDALAAMVGADVPLAELAAEARHRFVRALRDTRVPVARSLGFGAAEVTRGGIPLAEVDPKTMESRVAPRIFPCGEVLDVDGPIGGFNFQAAFATGRLAGLHA